MATRLYFSKIAPNSVISGRANGSWAGGFLAQPKSGAHWVWRLTPTKAAAGAKFSPTCWTNQQGNFDALFVEYMTYPLDAQTIAGTIDLCSFLFARWATLAGDFGDSDVRLKLHVYIAVGQSRVVRHTLLDNYVDATDIVDPDTGISTWTSLTAPAALTSGDSMDGDVVVVEYGLRVVSSPTPTPTYPPTENTGVTFWTVGAVAAQADATPGSTNSALTPWLEFSQTLTFQAAPAAPANNLCVNAIPVSSFPYVSPFIDTSEAAGTQRETFWSFVPSATGRMIIHTLGSNFGTDIDTLATCAGGFPSLTGVTGTNQLAAHRSQACFVADVTAGVGFIVRARNSTGTFNAVNGGGALQLSACYVQTPAVDDLYLPAGAIAVFREGQLTNINPDFEDSFPTGIAFDYTQRPMDDVGNGGTSNGIRVLVGLFSFPLVEILDATTLNAGESEIDFIGDTWDPGDHPGPAQLYITEAGLLYAGWWGNGFLYALGIGADIPALLNTIADDPDFSDLKVIDATFGDNQPGGPFAAARQRPAVADTAAWAFTIDEASGVMYYTSSGLYIPLGGQTVQRWNVDTEVQGADLVTLASGGGLNPGVKGLTLLSDRSVLVCNGTNVKHVSAAGAVLATFTPSVPLDSSSLIDVKVTQDENFFWVVDLDSCALFKFSLISGLEVGYYPTYMRPGTLVQMALFNPEPLPPPPEPPAPAPACPDTLNPASTDADCAGVQDAQMW